MCGFVVNIKILHGKNMYMSVFFFQSNTEYSRFIEYFLDSLMASTFDLISKLSSSTSKISCKWGYIEWLDYSKDFGVLLLT